MKLAPSLHRVGSDLVAAYLVEEGGALTLVDAGVPGQWSELEAEVRAMGRAIGDIRGVVLTHGDTDHIGMAERLRRDHGIPVFVHEADAALARGETKKQVAMGPRRIGPLLRFLWYAGRRGGLRPPPLTEVRTMAGGETLDLPGSPRVIHVPGHTPGSVVLHVPPVDAAFVGDAMTTRHVLTGVEGPQPAPFTVDVERADAAFASLEDLGVRWVLPGHGPPWDGGIAKAVRRYREAVATERYSPPSARRTLRQIRTEPALMTTTATRVDRMRASVAPFLRFFSGPFDQLNREPDVANFAVGNPQELPLPAYVGALGEALPPRDKDWFAYKLSEPASQRIVADALRARSGLDWDPADVAMTNGGFAALAVTIRALVEPGDEVLFCSPPWFFYELLVLAAGAEPTRVSLDPPAFDLDVDRVAAGITPRTRAVIVNSPHNPSGRIFSAETFADLATALSDASARAGRPVWVISDEPYRRIAFDGRDVPSPSTAYPHTAITYSYGKQTLAPGQRIGYIAIPPTCPDRAELRDRIFLEQMATGYSWPNALLQHALADIEETVVDIDALQRRRDRLVPALRDLGYEASMPEGTFYTMARAPIEDDAAFADILARHRVLVLPGSIVEVPGWFRVSLTASDEMVEMSIPRFAAAREEAGV